MTPVLHLFCISFQFHSFRWRNLDDELMICPPCTAYTVHHALCTSCPNIRWRTNITVETQWFRQWKYGRVVTLCISFHFPLDLTLPWMKRIMIIFFINQFRLNTLFNGPQTGSHCFRNPFVNWSFIWSDNHQLHDNYTKLNSVSLHFSFHFSSTSNE